MYELHRHCFGRELTSWECQYPLQGLCSKQRCYQQEGEDHFVFSIKTVFMVLSVLLHILLG